MSTARNELLTGELDMVRTELAEMELEMSQLELVVDPALKGSIVLRFVKCSKPHCHCMKGGSKHGPYPHLQWWNKGKIKTKYINRKIIGEYAKKVDGMKRLTGLRKQYKELQARERKLLKDLCPDEPQSRAV